MAGIPGKGGKAGQSGRKPAGGAVKAGPVYPVRLPEDLYVIAKRKGQDWVRSAIRDKAEREAADAAR